MKNGLNNSIKESGDNLLGFMDVVTQKIVELNKRVLFLEKQDMKNALRIHELQKITGTHPDGK